MKFRAIQTKQNTLDYNRDLVVAYLSRNKSGTRYEVEIRKPRATDSDPMRSYYFGGVLETFMEHLGYDKHEKLLFHHQLKLLYFDPQPDEHGFKHVPSVFSKKSKIDTKGKSDFIEWVRRLAAKEGCYIEDPN